VKGATTVLVAHDHKICGIISLADKVRQESKKAIMDLKSMGIRTVMLTGDNEVVSKMVADAVGVDEVYAQLLPQDKVTKIEELVAKGRHVAMVGDGINDAPALARANVGIGMGAGTDVAIEEADVVLMTDDLEKIANVIRMSRQGYRDRCCDRRSRCCTDDRRSGEDRERDPDEPTRLSCDNGELLRHHRHRRNWCHTSFHGAP